ncbi:MAG TPA: DUF1003 domain-containing protein [Blastocatellia bacterium]|nr:DUF1003 domain-containing protein [Blastocatellia bacterium]
MNVLTPKKIALRVNRRETARKLLQVELEKLPVSERLIVERFIDRGRVARDVMREFDEQLTFGERLADRVASFGGSWTFIGIFMLFLVGWMLFNSIVLVNRAYDPYPYILLNLILSCIAALQAPVIMMSQNRSAETDRMHAQNDYHVNVKAELEILQLHEKINELREHDWLTLIEMQQQQIEMMQRVIMQVCPAAGDESAGNG